MKKSIVLAAFLGLASFAVNAQTAAPATPAAPATNAVVTDIKQAEEPSLKREELPEPVRKALDTGEFKGQEFVSAKLVKENNEEFYAIRLKQAEKTTVVKLNKEGKKVS